MEIRKRKWISWKIICKPGDEGGLGIKNLIKVQVFAYEIWLEIDKGGIYVGGFFQKEVSWP